MQIKSKYTFGGKASFKSHFSLDVKLEVILIKSWIKQLQM